MSTEAAALALQDRALLWSTGEIRATDVVTGACDALVAGLDSPALRTQAACTVVQDQAGGSRPTAGRASFRWCCTRR